MTYLLTGATGLVGRRLIAKILERGDTVNYLARKREGKLDSRASFHSWDHQQPPDLQGMGHVDAVINLAGEPIAQRWTPEVKARIRKSRVEGTRYLVDGFKSLRDRPGVLVEASAVGFYGDAGEELLTEDHKPGTGFLADVCVEWEREAQRAEDLGTRVVSLRTAMVLAREGGALPQMLTPFRLGLGGPFGNGKQWMPWIHLEDLTELFLFAARQPAVRGALNAAAPEPVRNQQFAQALGKAIHRPAVIPAPAFALKAVLGELASFVLSSQRVVPQRTLAAGFSFRYGDLHQALLSLV